MKNEVSSYKYRNLPIASLFAGVLSLAIFSSGLITYFNIGVILVIIISLVAIVCGSIDLKKIRKVLHRSKIFKGFDITGIVLGSIIFLLINTFMLGAILLP